MLSLSKSGYRTGKENCKEKDWVIDLEHTKLFDEMDYELVMEAVDKPIEANGIWGLSCTIL